MRRSWPRHARTTPPSPTSAGGLPGLPRYPHLPTTSPFPLRFVWMGEVTAFSSIAAPWLTRRTERVAGVIVHLECVVRKRSEQYCSKGLTMHRVSRAIFIVTRCEALVGNYVPVGWWCCGRQRGSGLRAGKRTWTIKTHGASERDNGAMSAR